MFRSNFLQPLMIGLILLLAQVEKAEAYEWRGRRQSTNIEDRRSQGGSTYPTLADFANAERIYQACIYRRKPNISTQELPGVIQQLEQGLLSYTTFGEDPGSLSTNASDENYRNALHAELMLKCIHQRSSRFDLEQKVNILSTLSHAVRVNQDVRGLESETFLRPLQPEGNKGGEVVPSSVSPSTQ